MERKLCAGCGFLPKVNHFYEGDPITVWCDDCFVDDAKLKEIQSKMPFCQTKKRVKYRVVPFLSFKK